MTTPYGSPFSVTTSDDPSIEHLLDGFLEGRVRGDGPDRRTHRVPDREVQESRTFALPGTEAAVGPTGTGGRAAAERVPPARLATRAPTRRSDREVGHVVEAEDTDHPAVLDDREVGDSVLPKVVEGFAEGRRRVERDDVGRVRLLDGRRVEKRLDVFEHPVDGDDTGQFAPVKDGEEPRVAVDHEPGDLANVLVRRESRDVPGERPDLLVGLVLRGGELPPGDDSLEPVAANHDAPDRGVLERPDEFRDGRVRRELDELLRDDVCDVHGCECAVGTPTTAGRFVRRSASSVDSTRPAHKYPRLPFDFRFEHRSY